MSLRRDAHRGAVGTKSLSFFEGAVKASLTAGAGQSRIQDIAAAEAPPATERDLPGRPAPRHENLAPPGSAPIIVAHSMDKQPPPSPPCSFGGEAGSC